MHQNDRFPAPRSLNEALLSARRIRPEEEQVEQQTPRQSPAETEPAITGFQFPLSLETGEPMTLGERTLYLFNHKDYMRTNYLVEESLLVGAERMDERLVANGREPIHAGTLDTILDSPTKAQVFRRGYEEIIDPDQDSLKAKPKEIALLLKKHLDPLFNNPVLVHEVLGERYKNRPVSAKYAFLDRGCETLIRNQRWPPELRAMMMAVGMRQTASRQAREIALPLLDHDISTLPELKPGFETAYWERKVIGNDKYEGAAFYLGYVEKSRELLRKSMRKMWGQEYEENRQIFLSASFMRIGTLEKPERANVYDKRKQIFASLAGDDFPKAKEQLQEVAQAQPDVFSRPGQEFLLGKKSPEDDTAVIKDAPF